MIVKHTSSPNTQLLLRRDVAEVHLHVADMRTPILPSAIVLSPQQARALSTVLLELAEALDKGPAEHHVALQTQDSIGRYFHDVAGMVDIIRNDELGATIIGHYPHTVVYGWNAGRAASDTASEIAAYWRENRFGSHG